MKTKFFTFVFFLFFSLSIFSQNSDTNNALVDSINVTGLKKTNFKYFLNVIPIKKGGIWNEEKKKELKKELDGMKDIISTYEITEENISINAININIDIKEKGAFILVPFATYSNSQGLKPQIIFRYYNLGGVRKYLKSELEFYPTESMNFILNYIDPAVMNNKRFSYELNTNFRFSTMNYYANYDFENKKYKNGIPPIGVIGGNPIGPWNDEHFLRIIFGGKFNYRTKNNIKIRPNFKIDYKTIFEKIDEIDTTDKIGDVTKDLDTSNVFKSEIGLDLAFPIKKINAFFEPEFDMEYVLNIGEDVTDDPEIQNKYYATGFDSLKPELEIGFNFNLPYVKAKLKPYTRFVYEKVTNYGATFVTDHYFNIIFGVEFKKTLKYKKAKHVFKVETSFDQRLVGDYVFDRFWYTEPRSFPFFFKSEFDFEYELDFNFYKLHRYKMELLFFARYNQLKEFSKYAIGKKPGKMEGFLGIAGFLKYELPLFNVTTPKLISKTMKRDLNWQVYWDFYIDFGLAFTDLADDPYTLDQNFLHLYPALGVATGVRVVPEFLPIDIELKVGFDVYNIVRVKTISGGNIVIEFAINDKLR